MNRTVRLFLLVQLMICVNGALGCGGEESKNECLEEKEIRMEAIANKCTEPNLVGCCYCSCELKGAPTGDGECACTNWQLTANTPTDTCEGGALTKASNCINSVESCKEQSKTVVQLNCTPP